MRAVWRIMGVQFGVLREKNSAYYGTTVRRIMEVVLAIIQVYHLCGYMEKNRHPISKKFLIWVSSKYTLCILVQAQYY